MTTSIRKGIPTPLEQKYTEMKKEFAGNKRNPHWLKNVGSESLSSTQIDTVTLSSKQSQLKRSQSVSPDEKNALQTQFSVHA